MGARPGTDYSLETRLPAGPVFWRHWRQTPSAIPPDRSTYGDALRRVRCYCRGLGRCDGLLGGACPTFRRVCDLSLSAEPSALDRCCRRPLSGSRRDTQSARSTAERPRTAASVGRVFGTAGGRTRLRPRRQGDYVLRSNQRARTRPRRPPAAARGARSAGVGTRSLSGRPARRSSH